MKNVSKNLLSLSIGEVVSRLLGFVATTYLARTLHPDGFGLINVGLAVLGYLILFANPGIDLFGARIVAQSRGNEQTFVGEILGLRLFLAVCCIYTASVISIIVGGMNTVTFLIVLYSASLLPMSLYLDWFYQGKERMSGIGWSRVVVNVVYLVLLLRLVRNFDDILSAPIVFFGGSIAGVLVLMIMYKKNYGNLQLQWDVASLFTDSGRWYHVMKHALPIGLGTILTQVSYNFPLILLGMISSLSVVGYFGAALRVVFFLMIFDRLVASVLLPAIARYQKEAPGQLQTLLSFVLKTVMVIVLPICIGGVVLADRIIELIYGFEFAQSVPVFQWLICYFFFSALGSVYVFGLIGIGQEKIFAKMMIWGTVVQVLFIILGSVILNAVGAAIGYAFGEAVIMFLMISRFQKFVHVLFWFSLAEPAVSSVIMGIFLYVVRPHDLLLSIVFGAIVFALTLVVIRGYTKEDLVMLRSKLL